MSRQNKVNPGMYTQRGRLTQDDAARELKRQRTIGSEHTWQPSKKDHFPRLASNEGDAALGEETSGDKESGKTTPATENAKPAARVTQAATPKQAAASRKSASAKAASPKKQSRAVQPRTAKKTAGKARAAKTARPAAKRAATKTARKAVLARNVGGGGSKPRTTAKRRKS